MKIALYFFAGWLFWLSLETWRQYDELWNGPSDTTPYMLGVIALFWPITFPITILIVLFLCINKQTKSLANKICNLIDKTNEQKKSKKRSKK